MALTNTNLDVIEEKNTQSENKEKGLYYFI